MYLDKRELLKAAFSGNEVDKVPVGFWHHFVLGEEQFEGLDKPDILDRVIEGHLEYYKKTNPDMMKLMNEGFMGYPPIMDNPLNNGADLLKIKSIGENHPWITMQVAHVNKLVELFCSEVMCFYNIFAPLQVIRIKLEFLDLDFERFVFLAENYPDELKAAGMEIQKDICILVEKLLTQTKLDGIYYCVQNIQSKQYTKEVYDKYIRPTELPALTLANKYSKYNILHICGYAHHKNDLTFYKEYSAGAYNWAVHTENVPLGKGRKIFNAKCILGGFDNNPDTLIDSGSSEEIEAFTKALIEENGFKGFILGADCSVPNKMDDGKIRIISDASNKYKK